MKHEMAQRMEKSNLDALIISGATSHNPPLSYFVRGAFFTKAEIIICRGAEPVLFYYPMERDTALKSGLKCVCYDRYPFSEYLKITQGDQNTATALRLAAMLADLGLNSGKIAFCGRVEFDDQFAFVRKLGEIAPQYEVVSGVSAAILNETRFTKDNAEIEAIRRVGHIAIETVARVKQFLSDQVLDGDRLVTESGEPITIGMVKGLINLWLGELGAENPEGTIFAQGCDAGVPHNQGNDDEGICAGKAIVFDFFPCESGGGYFFDFTRTWCIGYAPETVQKTYALVKNVHDQAVATIRPGMPFKALQKQTCEWFAEAGHPTVLQNPQTRDGFCHSVGHGMGLNIHERPFSGLNASEHDTLIPGTVFTIEPGLYYPDSADGYGVRIEDSYYMDENGTVQLFVAYPYELVIEVRKKRA